jgi:glucose/mannose-6-phosphate isomerase
VNLDDLHLIQKLDPQDMLAEIGALPAQLAEAWLLGQSQPLPDKEGIRQVVISGMGGSAIGADLLAAYLAPACAIPVFVQRDYILPAWARGPETLVIASSHSGNTEETLEAFDLALQARCRLMAVTTGGALEERALKAGIPIWKFSHGGQPRAAVGYSFGLLLALFARLGWIPSPTEEIAGAVAAMKAQQASLLMEVPAAHNPAKRMAGQLVGRWVNMYASGILTPVARRWKGQCNEVAKAGAGFEVLPEADHNALAGLVNPVEFLAHTTTVFLRAPSDHARNRLRSELTCREFMLEGLNTEVYEAQGESPLAHLWTALHFGDYSAFYLAMAYGMNPTPVTALENFKAEIKKNR